MRLDGLFVSLDEATASGGANAAPPNGRRAALGQCASFKVSLGPDASTGGAAARPASMSPPDRRQKDASSSSSLVTATLVLLAASAGLAYAMLRHQQGQQPLPEPDAAGQGASRPHVHKADPIAAARFARPAGNPAPR